jgi:hypothetical protein
MGAYAREQNILTDDADHLPPLSNKKSDATVVSSFAYAVNKPGNRWARMPWTEKVECPLSLQDH